MDKNTGIPLPLEPKQKPDKHGNDSEFSYQRNPRKYLASFMGTHYKDKKGLSFGIVRDILRLLNKEEDGFVIYTHCHQAHKETACVGAAEQERLTAFLHNPAFDYHQLMQESQYCLVPKGRQPASYRFLESVLAGCTPVYISDPGDNYTYSFVFSSKIPWEKIMLYVHGSSVNYMRSFLQSIPHAEWEDRNRFLQQVAQSYFSSVQGIAKHLLLEIIERITNYNSQITSS